MKRLSALPGTVICAPGDFERTEQGHQLVPDSTLAFGREVWPPWAVVLDSGDPDIRPGQRVICQNDEGAPKWHGMRVVTLATTRRRSDPAASDATLRRARRLHAAWRPKDPEEVSAVLHADGTLEAVGTRVVVALEPAPLRSVVLEVVETVGQPLDWGIVTSVGPRARELRVGDRIACRHDVGNRWSLAGRAWLSVRELDVDLVERPSCAADLATAGNL